MDKRELLKALRDAPPREALDAIMSEAHEAPDSEADVSEWEKWARDVWVRSLEAAMFGYP